MLIENPDAFKSWLTSVLEPLCDADPEALAKYVFALVKKDKSVDILRQGMLEQLDVFLQSETKSFVELLFKTIESQEYLVIPNTNPPNPNPPPVKKSPELISVKEIKPIIPVSTLPNLSESINGVKKEETITTTTTSTVSSTKRDHRKSDSEKDDRRRRRSRSRSWDRNVKRSRSRDRSPRRSRPWRNKSPPPRRGGWRRSRSGSPPATRIRSRSRSPRHGGSYRSGAPRYRNRSPPRSPTRSRSRSLDRREKEKKEKDNKDENSGGATPTQDSNHGDTDMRLTQTTQSIQSVVAAAAAAAPPLPQLPLKRRCRDFDEKGYCMRGEMCPYDHGVDPVVLEDSALTRVLAFAPNNGGVGVAGVEHPPPPPPPHHHPRPIIEYNPSAPGMWHRAGFRPRVPQLAGPQFGPLPSMQRELISVPVVNDVQPGQPPGFKRRAEPEVNITPPKRKQGFDFNRLGPRTPTPKTTNCSLELKKIPRGLNNITHLNNHFSKFGKIINIQVNFEGDPEGALVTFSSHAEANAAYRSTEAVLNNRFIKVFWHSSSNAGAERQENVPPGPQGQTRPVKDRLGGPVTNKVLNLVQTNSKDPPLSDKPDDMNLPTNPSAPNPPAPNPPNSTTVASKSSRALALQAIVKSQEILAAKEQLKKKHEEKRKEAMKLTQDLRKRKQELLEKQLAQQKLLIEKLEKTNPTGQQRDLLMSTIKTVQDSIESIRRELIPITCSRAPRTREDAQRQLLDAELDLMSCQAEGGDTSELQRRLAELRAQAHSIGGGALARGAGLGAGVPPAAVPGLGGKRGRGRRGGFRKAVGMQLHVDHRPTRVLVSGYEGDESESVLAHFAQFGEICDYIPDTSTPALILKYKTRKEAELALLKGKHFQDRTLSVTWCTGAHQTVTRALVPPATTAINNANMSTNTSVGSVTPAVAAADDVSTAARVVSSASDPEDGLHVEEVAAVEEKVEQEKEIKKVDNVEDQLLEGDDENVLGAEYTEEALLQDDEEEEETEDDRSWRR